jgi:hypothetical protein
MVIDQIVEVAEELKSDVSVFASSSTVEILEKDMDFVFMDSFIAENVVYQGFLLKGKRKIAVYEVEDCDFNNVFVVGRNGSRDIVINV